MAHSLDMHYVSSANRFLAHVKLADMVEDCHDAVDWSRDTLPSLLGESGGLDPDNYVIAGSSAGDGLATMLIPNLENKPRVFLNVYGTTNLKELQDYLESDMVQSQLGSRKRSSISSKEWRDKYYKPDPSKALTMTRTTILVKQLRGPDHTPESFSRALQNEWEVSDEIWEAISRGEPEQPGSFSQAHVDQISASISKHIGTSSATQNLGGGTTVPRQRSEYKL